MMGWGKPWWAGNKCWIHTGLNRQLKAMATLPETGRAGGSSREGSDRDRVNQEVRVTHMYHFAMVFL